MIRSAFVRTPLREANFRATRTLGIGKDDVVRQAKLKDTLGGRFTPFDAVSLDELPGQGIYRSVDHRLPWLVYAGLLLEEGNGATAKVKLRADARGPIEPPWRTDRRATEVE